MYGGGGGFNVDNDRQTNHPEADWQVKNLVISVCNIWLNKSVSIKLAILGELGWLDEDK